ncbi:MAG: hypothetical protein K9G59_12610 [Caulobacter sp.]|nr:hypothetical protein [Caulobacter sp.]
MSLSCFLLVDPRAQGLDARTVQDLAYDLQLRLFGSGGGGEVELIAFEGDSQQVARFASLDQHDVRRAAAGDSMAPPLVGRLTRITAADVTPIAIPGMPEPGTDPQVSGRVAPAEIQTPVFNGVYFAAKETFLGSAICSREIGFNIVDGIHPTSRDMARMHDSTMVSLAAETLKQRPDFTGMIYVPLCYAPLIHRQEREVYTGWLNALPKERRSNLAVAVYDTPRDPSFSALSQIKAFLDGYFKVVDLRTFDPDFSVERLAPGAVQSVTLILPDASQLTRIAAIRRFAERMDKFRQKRIWPSVTNVRNAVEFETCLARRIPFVSGRAISTGLAAPVGVETVPAGDLPVDDRYFRDVAPKRAVA